MRKEKNLKAAELKKLCILRSENCYKCEWKKECENFKKQIKNVEEPWELQRLEETEL